VGPSIGGHAAPAAKAVTCLSCALLTAHLPALLPTFLPACLPVRSVHSTVYDPEGKQLDPQVGRGWGSVMEARQGAGEGSLAGANNSLPHQHKTVATGSACSPAAGRLPGQGRPAGLLSKAWQQRPQTCTRHVPSPDPVQVFLTPHPTPPCQPSSPAALHPPNPPLLSNFHPSHYSPPRRAMTTCAAATAGACSS